jgi:hypothetical protein
MIHNPSEDIDKETQTGVVQFPTYHAGWMLAIRVAQVPLALDAIARLLGRVVQPAACEHFLCLLCFLWQQC